MCQKSETYVYVCVLVSARACVCVWLGGCIYRFVGPESPENEKNNDKCKRGDIVTLSIDFTTKVYYKSRMSLKI